MHHVLIDASHAKVLFKIAETRSFTATAASLGISQPSISQQVKRIEGLYGCTLFSRHNSGVELTSNGEAVLAYARAMASLDKNLRSQLAYNAGRPRVCIGLSQDACRTALPSVLRKFSSHHPDVELRVVSGSYETIARGIETRAIDLAVLKRNTRIANLKSLWTDKLVWIGYDDIRLPIRGPVPLILPLAPDPTRDIALRALESAGYTWRIVMESDDLASVEAALDAKLGITLASLNMRHHGAGPLESWSGLPKLPDVEYVLHDPLPEAGTVAVALAAAIRSAAGSGFVCAANAEAELATVSAKGCGSGRHRG